MLALVFATGSTGALVSRIGYYTPVLLVGIVMMAVGAGLLTTLQVDTPQSKWIGYEFLYGFGLGSTFQVPNIAAQTVLRTKDVPVGTALVMFGQLLGGAVFISVGQNVLNNQLLGRLGHLDGFDPEHLKTNGATTLTDLPDDVKLVVLHAYNEALRNVFQVALVLACLSVVGAVFMEWKSVKKDKLKKRDAEEGGEGRDVIEANDTSAEKAPNENRIDLQGQEGAMVANGAATADDDDQGATVDDSESHAMTMVEMDGEKGGKERVESRASDSDLDKLKGQEKEIERGTMGTEDLNELKKELEETSIVHEENSPDPNAKQGQAIQGSKVDEKEKEREEPSHPTEKKDSRA